MEIRGLMCFTEFDDISLTHQRLTACEEEGMDSQILCLTNHIIELFITKVHLMAVFCCPASGAMKITCGSRVDQDRPGNIAIILLG